MKTTPTTFKQYLTQILENGQNTIARFLAELALEEYVPASFIKRICDFGPIGANVFEMFFLFDARDFFYDHYEEIEQIREEYGLFIRFDCDLQNYLACAAVQVVAYQLYQVYEEGL